MRITVWPLLRILSIAHLRADWLPLSLSIATATKGFPPSFLSEFPLPTHISLLYPLSFQLPLTFFQENNHNPEITNSPNHQQRPKNSTFSLPAISTKSPSPCFFSHSLSLPKKQRSQPPTFLFLFVLQFSLFFLSNKGERTTLRHTLSHPKLALLIPSK